MHPEMSENATATSALSQQSLSDTVNSSIKRFLVATKGTKINNLYEYFLEEIEPTLLELVMNRVKGNQSEAAKILGLSRGTTRKKLKQYFGEKYCGSRDQK